MKPHARPLSVVEDVMTRAPVALPPTAPVAEAARAMRDHDIGDVLVVASDTLYGILTDRDIVVRVVAAARDPASTPLAEVCSRDVTSVPPDLPVLEAIRLMSERAVRRLPVVKDGNRPVGVLSLGDLAVVRDRRSALGEISAAPPNR